MTIEYRGEKFAGYNKPKRTPNASKSHAVLAKEGNKVKAYVQFKGRAIQFKERGELVLLKFAERLAEIGQVEGLPKLEGKRMLMVIAPKSQKKKASTGAAPAEPQG